MICRGELRSPDDTIVIVFISMYNKITMLNRENTMTQGTDPCVTSRNRPLRYMVIGVAMKNFKKTYAIIIFLLVLFVTVFLGLCNEYNSKAIISSDTNQIVYNNDVFISVDKPSCDMTLIDTFTANLEGENLYEQIVTDYDCYLFIDEYGNEYIEVEKYIEGQSVNASNRWTYILKENIAQK